MAFIVPLIIMLAIYIMRGIYPFGDSVYLRSDMYHQYAPFFSNLWDKIRNGGSLQYSWDIGMGSNFLALYGYYLSSPINWFIALFPKKNLLEIMDYIIMIKLLYQVLHSHIIYVNTEEKYPLLPQFLVFFTH